MTDLDSDGMADLKLTITLTYKADPAGYTDDDGSTVDGPSVVERMAAIDQKNFDDDPECLHEILADYEGSYDIKVEPLPEGEI